MTGLPLGFRALYASALEGHLRQQGEKALHQAYELGRQALTEGLGVLDLTLLHHDVLADLMLDGLLDDESEGLELAAEFLAECLSPFEMTLRGVREANARLTEANGSLTAAHGALAHAHARLKAEIEERLKVEQALRHAEKLRTVGLLAGGVAHHFNNLLTVVLGSLELARRRLPPDTERLAKLLSAAAHAAERGAEVTRQLLSFSRQQMLQPRLLEPAAWLGEASALLPSALRGDIVVETAVAPDLPAVRVDPGQLDLALLNLAVNARDAMPGGGVLSISIDRQRAVDERLGLDGDYLVIEVADTGTGVPEDLLSEVFEPFFSTKSSGPGAGLGLSQVHGFAHQSGGAVDIRNRPQGGAAIRLWLPVAEEALEGEATGLAAGAGIDLVEDGSGKVLVVEDDPDVAGFTYEALLGLGYSVRLTHRAQAALDLLNQGEAVDLLFSDVIMPGGMDGVQLAEEARRRFPSLPVLLTTGYNEAAATIGQRGLPVLTKPFTTQQLAAKVREALRGGTSS